MMAASGLHAGEPQRLHPWSALFVAIKFLRHVALPLLTLLLLGRQGRFSWELWVAVPLALLTLWSVLQARRYRYQVLGAELVIHEGVLGRRVRHVPFARIQNTSQKRTWLHRVLGVTELRLESAAGGQPEAVMQVLGLNAAAALEGLVRHELPHDAAQPLSDAQPVAAAVDASAAAMPRTWLALDAGEILRLGLCSNKGMVIIGVAASVIFPKEALRNQFLSWIRLPLDWLSAQMGGLLQAGHTAWLVAEALALLLTFWVLLKLLSVALAFFRYHGFTLTQWGDKLVQQRGLSTRISASARLPRLQHFELLESWWHRRLGRCQLKVTVAGDTGEHEQGVDPGGQFDEIAPVASPEQARRMLQDCLPGLHWSGLQWQPLQGPVMAWMLWGRLRSTLPLIAALLLLNGVLISHTLRALPWPLALSLAGLWLLAVVAHAVLWAKQAAFAQQGPLLLFRHGVLTRRWQVLEGARLQQLSLFSAPRDRMFGLVRLRADAQGGRQVMARALEIPCLLPATAEAIRRTLWTTLRSPA